MYSIWICGAGKIGTSIAHLLAYSNDYAIHITDLHFEGDDVKRLLEADPNVSREILNIKNEADVENFLKADPKQAVIACLPYNLNLTVAQYAKAHGMHYFDLTEDVSVTEEVKKLAEGARTAFVPQCGLAPGYVGLVANHLIQYFDAVENVALRVGALPQQANNALHYALNWSTEGIINEYGNFCPAIVNYKKVSIPPLEGLERLIIEGRTYEAFNTSGGLGSLLELYEAKVKSMNYKSIRYPGHCSKMRVLMNDLKLNEARDILKEILEKSIPRTHQDLVLVYISVTGFKSGVYWEKTFAKTIYPKKVGQLHLSAIQLATTAGICAVLDLILANPQAYQGFIYQEKFNYEQFIKKQFGQYYAS